MLQSKFVRAVEFSNATRAVYTYSVNDGAICCYGGRQLDDHWLPGDKEYSGLRAKYFPDCNVGDAVTAADELAIRAATGESVSLSELVRLAHALLSEDGENPEYDRAIAELVTDAAGLSMQVRDEIGKAIRENFKKEKTHASA